MDPKNHTHLNGSSEPHSEPHDEALSRLIDRARAGGRLTGDPVLDDLVSTRPPLRPEFPVALEQRLLDRLPTLKREEDRRIHPMTEVAAPPRPRRPLHPARWIAAVVLLLAGAAVLLPALSRPPVPFIYGLDSNYGGSITYIVVAIQPLSRGQTIEPHDVALWGWNPASLPAGALTSLEAVFGKVARMDIPANQPLLEHQLTSPRPGLQPESTAEVVAMLPTDPNPDIQAATDFVATITQEAVDLTATAFAPLIQAATDVVATITQDAVYKTATAIAPLAQILPTNTPVLSLEQQATNFILTVTQQVIDLTATQAAVNAAAPSGGLFITFTPVPQVAVVVARQDIPAGAVLIPDLLTVALYPAEAVPDGSFNETAVLVGRQSTEFIARGYPVTGAQLVTQNMVGTVPTLAVTPLPGSQLISVPLDRIASFPVDDPFIRHPSYIQPGETVELRGMFLFVDVDDVYQQPWSTGNPTEPQFAVSPGFDVTLISQWTIAPFGADEPLINFAVAPQDAAVLGFYLDAQIPLLLTSPDFAGLEVDLAEMPGLMRTTITPVPTATPTNTPTLTPTVTPMPTATPSARP